MSTTTKICRGGCDRILHFEEFDPRPDRGRFRSCRECRKRLTDELPDWQLPEDGIFDHVAVEAIVEGSRKVKLTLREAGAAFRLMRTRELMSLRAISVRTGIDPEIIERWAERASKQMSLFDKGEVTKWE